MDEAAGDEANGDRTENGIRPAAESYVRRGWSVIPVPHQSKNPGFKG